MELKAGINADETLVIRPKHFSNIARFINGINNAQNPSAANVRTIRMLAEGRACIVLLTSRDVQAGECLLYDYNAGGINMYDTSEFV